MLEPLPVKTDGLQGAWMLWGATFLMGIVFALGMLFTR